MAVGRYTWSLACNTYPNQYITIFRSSDVDKANFSATQVFLSPSPPQIFGSGTVGLASDSDNYLRAVNQCKNNVTRIRVWEENIGGQMVHKGQALSDHDIGIGPYTYSDMTGYSLRIFTAPQG